MDAVGVLVALCGALLVLLILVDVFLTVLHIDRDGPVAGNIHHGMWRLAVALSRAAPGRRRVLLALAGPLMIVVTFFVWLAVYLIGFAFFYWPFLDLFATGPDATAASFVDALYFSGMTGSTLGYGDVTPSTPLFKIVAIVEATLGFGLLSGVVTYLLNIVSGVTERNALALWVYHESAQSSDGIEAVIRSTCHEDVGDLRMRFVLLAHALQSVHQKVLQFPILDLFYRSKDPIYGPEVMLKAAAEMAIAGQLLALSPRARRLRPATDDLGHAVYALMRALARQHMPLQVRQRIDEPVPEPDDMRRVRQIRDRLETALDMSLLPQEREPEQEPAQAADEAAVVLAARTRIFLDELDRLTSWKLDHPH